MNINYLFNFICNINKKNNHHINNNINMNNMNKTKNINNTDKTDKNNNTNEFVTNESTNNKIINKKYPNHNFNKDTTEKYYNCRINQLDAITGEPIENSKIIMFSYMWNPFTGKKIHQRDEYGPLCFNALILYEYYFVNRYKGLWIQEDTLCDIQNTYGIEIIGTGNNINENHAMFHKYLYRLPIIDCYIPEKNSDIKYCNSYDLVTTIGPILTVNDIKKIDRIVHIHDPTRTPLKYLKELYDGALDNHPDITKHKKMFSNLSDNELKYKYNIGCIDRLVALKK